MPGTQPANAGVGECLAEKPQVQRTEDPPQLTAGRWRQLAHRVLEDIPLQGPRVRRPYAITPAGKQAFGRWLDEPPMSGRDALRNPIALRVALGTHLSGTQLHKVYERATEYHTRALAEASEQARRAKRDGDEGAAVALEFAVGYHHAALTWLGTAPQRPPASPVNLTDA